MNTFRKMISGISIFYFSNMAQEAYMVYPQLWDWYLKNLVPLEGEGYKNSYLRRKFESLISDLLDPDTNGKDDIRIVISRYLILPNLIDGQTDRLAEEIDDLIDHVYENEFKPLYIQYILPEKSGMSADEQTTSGNETEDVSDAE
jgi:hypothetical protein